MPEGDTFVQSLERGLSVIRSFHADVQKQSLSEVAASTGLTRATARRFLLTLVSLGYVRSDGKDFSLTPRVLELGFSYLSGLSLPAVAQPHLERLSRAVGESTSASVLDGDDIVYVARVPTRRIMSVQITIGTRFPAFATSMGRVLLAALPSAALDEYLAALHPARFTASTVLERDGLAKAIGDVRTQGWALVDQELEVGLRSIAAPIYKGGTVVAAINVSTSAGVGTLDETVDGVLPVLLEASARISDDLEHVELGNSSTGDR
jgi:IclR family pca regulon transcriptional regulator